MHPLSVSAPVCGGVRVLTWFGGGRGGGGEGDAHVTLNVLN